MGGSNSFHVYRIFALVFALCGLLVFFFVPETFWDRAPIPRVAKESKPRPAIIRQLSAVRDMLHGASHPTAVQPSAEPAVFAPEAETQGDRSVGEAAASRKSETGNRIPSSEEPVAPRVEDSPATAPSSRYPATMRVPETPPAVDDHIPREKYQDTDADAESQSIRSTQTSPYTATLRVQPARSFARSLKPFNGRLNKDKWHKVAVRPLILFTYPAVLWSSVVYACSVGWLIVISESVAVIYREEIYQFNALQTGLVYISPFVGGILGSAVAGRISDVIVKAMARRNGGLYEPEFRLVMAIPIAITTVIGLIGFGWSAQIHDHWMVPTAFFGIISFGCTMGSTTSITFCVDSYRQYAGEALVTLNFCKNVLHGLVFSLFVTGWLSNDGPKSVYMWIGIIQLVVLLFTIPMYIFGKRLRMWTVRRNLMERF